MVTMGGDPWKDIAPAEIEGDVNARRVDAHGRWNFFWGVDATGACLLLLQHGAGTSVPSGLPRLRGIQISDFRSHADTAVLGFRLAELAHRDIFERLCRDIIDHCTHAVSETDAVRTAINRTWRWHHLLRGGGDGRLTTDEQKGLVGELVTLERLFLPALKAADAVNAWIGPLDAPKDFEIGMVGVEVKAHRPGGAQTVTISSEHQLDRTGLEDLFLYVIEVATAPASSTVEGATITEIAARVRARIDESDPSALTHFDTLLTSAGLHLDDDYSDARWIDGPGRLYEVRPDFPRISSNVPPSISRVRYSLSLLDCEQFLTTARVLTASLQRGGQNVG